MTTINTHAMTISICQRYRDLVSDRWPVIVMPQPDELLSSWLHRLAHANGIAPKGFARVLGVKPRRWSARLDLKLPAEIANLLSANTGIAPDQLTAMTLSHDLPKKLLLPLRCNGHRDSSAWLQFCGRCLSEDEQPYFRRRWRLASRISCTKHGCRLRDRCPDCHGQLAVYDQCELVPQHYCARCGFDLRCAPIVPINLAARALDRCIDNICSLEALGNSPSGSMLIRRLLRMPGVGDRYSTKRLTNLSTAARTYCVQHLNPPSDLPVSVYALDDSDIAAGRTRRVIPLVQDRGAWIELLASALAQRRRKRPGTEAGNDPGAGLQDLLEAYVRTDPGPGRPALMWIAR